MEGAEAAVATFRLAFGTMLLAGAGATRVIDVAASTHPGTTVPAGLVRALGRSRDTAASLTRALSRAVPAVARDPVTRRIDSLRVLARVERGRSVVAATDALEFVAKSGTDWIVERLDVNRIVERLRLDDIIAGLELTDVIVSSTGGVTGHVLDTARTRAVDADTIVDRVTARLRHRRGTVPRTDADDTRVVAPAPG